MLFACNLWMLSVFFLQAFSAFQRRCHTLCLLTKVLLYAQAGPMGFSGKPAILTPSGA